MGEIKMILDNFIIFPLIVPHWVILVILHTGTKKHGQNDQDSDFKRWLTRGYGKNEGRP